MRVGSKILVGTLGRSSCNNNCFWSLESMGLDQSLVWKSLDLNSISEDHSTCQLHGVIDYRYKKEKQSH